MEIIHHRGHRDHRESKKIIYPQTCPPIFVVDLTEANHPNPERIGSHLKYLILAL
jgi:hypothetical protein